MTVVTTIADVIEGIGRIEGDAITLGRRLAGLKQSTVVFVTDRYEKCTPFFQGDNWGCHTGALQFNQATVEDFAKVTVAITEWMVDLRRILDQAPPDQELPRM